MGNNEGYHNNNNILNYNQNILNYYEKDKKQLTYFDLWLSKNKLIKYLYYPSLFKIDDNGSSQVNDHNHGVIINYEVFSHNKIY